MYDVHKVLVGVDLVCADKSTATYDLPPPTLEAIELGLRIGERWKLPVTFLTVIAESDDVSGNPEATAVLDQLLESARERGVEASSKIVVGRAWLEIIREVLREDYDLVLIGSRRHKTREVLLGTTGTKLMRKCPCPVWVARPDDSKDIPLIVAADDLTEVGRQAVELGVSAAQLLDARLLIVNAVQYPLEAALRRSGCPPEEIEDHRRSQREEATKTINEHLAPTDHRTLTHGVGIEIHHGPPDVVLCEAIEDHEADLLVMGTVARTGIPGLLVGNTAERLLPQVECSVLAVKPEGFETPVKLK